MVNFKIEEIIGHIVEAKFVVSTFGGWGSQLVEEKGRIIYSTYQDSLFFMRMGARNTGFKLDLEDIKEVKFIKKDNKKHNEYIAIWNNREQLVRERQERERAAYLREEQERRERYEREKREKEEAKQKALEEAKALGGFEELEKEIIEHYEASGEYWNKEHVLKVFLPVAQKLINKTISNVNDYPKYYFYKNDNPRFTAFIEKKLGIKLPKTQKGAIETLNNFLNK